MYDSDVGDWVYYRAKSGGALYQNEWFIRDGGSYTYKYYYGADAKGATGVVTVGGKLYYFYYNGRMATNTAFSYDGKGYLVDSEGNASQLAEGWNNISGSYYYVSSGEVYKDGVYKINSSYYGFDSSGRMYDGIRFEAYNKEQGRYGLHQAKTGGALYVNSWVQVNGRWYYYGESGIGPRGMTTVGGKQYYFNNGQMATNVAVSDGSTAYYADADGNLNPMHDAWNLINGSYYYAAGGTVYSDGVYKIGSSYYGFRSSGVMYDNEEFSTNNNELSDYGYHRAKAGGALYVNAWYQDGNGDWYYYGDCGLAANSITPVNGKQYYFYYDGRMATNCIVSDGSKAYAVDASGTFSSVKEGWNLVDGTYYYVSNGNLVYGIKTIGSTLYGFDDSGRMYNDESFSMWDSNDGRYYGYRAKAGGALIVSSWYRAEDGSWYYYGAGGKAPSGLETVGGQQYYFGSYGYMYTNTVVSDGTKVYAIDASGKLSDAKAGWNNAGGDYYYVEDGKLLTSTVRKIGASYYGFNGNGRMYDDQQFDLYDRTIDDWVYYRAKAGGALYVNEWYKNQNYYNDSYYYGAEGKAARGLTTVDGKQYYFEYSGYMAVNCAVSDGSKSYYADYDGTLTALNNGWNKIGDWYYYVANGVVCTGEVRRIGDNYYGFTYAGQMYSDTGFSIWTDGTTSYYRAKENGALYVNSWYQEGYSWYYYGDGGRAAAGLTTVGGKQYLFSQSGKMAVSTYAPSGESLYYADAAGNTSKVTADGLYRGESIYYVSNGKLLRGAWKEINGKKYYFESDGRACCDNMLYTGGKQYCFDHDGVLRTNVWILDWGSKYYATADGSLAVGEKQIGGKWYYFDEDGDLQTGLVNYKGNLYLCGNDGAYIGKATGNGWNEIKGSWYYVSNSRPASGLTMVGGVRYAFDYNGRMLTDTTYDGYVFNSSGKQVTSGWYMLNGFWYYVDPATGQYVNGEKQIDNKWYYFYEGGRMATGELFLNGKRVVYAANGVRQSSTDVKDGWYLIDGTYYYYENGKAFHGWKNDYYMVNGVMQTNTVVNGYYVGKDGAYVKSGWIKCDLYSFDTDGSYYGRYMYAKSGGKLAQNEWLQSGGSWYYFGSNYRTVRGLQIIDGKVYSFDDSGKMTATVSSTVKNGWLAVGSTYAYISGGQLLRDTLLADGGTVYAFNSYGYMVKNGFWYGVDPSTGRDGSRYFASNGKMAEYTGWQQINSTWYYFGADHVLQTGMLSVNSNNYYCNDGMTKNSWYGINGNLYHFNSSGVLDSQDTTQNGWVSKDGNWYYVKDGTLCRGLVTIGGKTYCFGSWYRMLKNTVYYSYRGYYFIGSDGTVSASAGWKQDAYGDWYYTDGTGRCLTGIQIINGAKYYFTSEGIWIK